MPNGPRRSRPGWPGRPGNYGGKACPHRSRSRAGRVRRQRRHGRVLIRAGIVRALGVGRDDREPRHRAGQAKGLLQQGVVQRRGGEVQFLGQHALDDQRVHRGPRRRVDPGQRERGRPVAVRTDPGDVIVDPLGVGQQGLAGRAGPRRLGPFPPGGAQQPEPELELVRGQVGGAGQLGEAALAETALRVHLAQPERRVHVPEGEEDVIVGGGPDRGDALGGVAHRDRILQARQAQGLRHGRPPAGRGGPGPAPGVQRRSERRDRAQAAARTHSRMADTTAAAPTLARRPNLPDRRRLLRTRRRYGIDPGRRRPGTPRMRSAPAVVLSRHTGRSPSPRARFGRPVTAASP